VNHVAGTVLSASFSPEDARVLLLAGLPTTPVELSEARTYAERFRYEPLDDLTDADARRAVYEAVEHENVTWVAARWNGLSNSPAATRSSCSSTPARRWRWQPQLERHYDGSGWST
jgi:hypothetical protein